MHPKELLILEILDRYHPREMYGLELIEASGGKLGRGTVYVHLANLEDGGFISSRLETEEEDLKPGQTARRLYQLKSGGARALRDARTEPGSTGGLVPAFSARHE